MSPQVAVEVRPAVAPDGRAMVLIQFSDGWLLVAPADARDLAARITQAAEEVEAS